jgi:hypothetical protein
MNMVTFSGYIAEQIRVCADRAKITPEAFVLSLFDKGCNAPKAKAMLAPQNKSLRRRVQCTSPRH